MPLKPSFPSINSPLTWIPQTQKVPIVRMKKSARTCIKLNSSLKRKKQVILTGPPGTSKTYTAFQVIHAFSGEEPPTQEDRPYQKLADYRFDPADKEEGGERDVVWDIVQFHQSYGYEDFVSGIEASSAQDQDGLKLERVDKVFLSMCEKAKNALDAHDGDADKAPKYVLIIDEINRGILGRIFGELILGLEYRGLPIRLQGRNGENGEDNEKKDTITIPDNLYLIGTMNTADRNIALVDHALRRRFRFVDMPPNPKLLEEVLKRKALSDKHREKILGVFDEVQRLFAADENARCRCHRQKELRGGTYLLHVRHHGGLLGQHALSGAAASGGVCPRGGASAGRHESAETRRKRRGNASRRRLLNGLRSGR